MDTEQPDTQRIVTLLGRLNANDPGGVDRQHLVYFDAPIDLEWAVAGARAAIALTAALPGALYRVRAKARPRGISRHARRDPRRTRCSSAAAAKSSAATAAVCRCRGRPIRRRRSASRRPMLPHLVAATRELGQHSVEREAADPPSILAWDRTVLAHRPLLSGSLKWVDTELAECLARAGRGCDHHHVGDEAVDLPAATVAGRSVIVARTRRRRSTPCRQTPWWLSPAH